MRLTALGILLLLALPAYAVDIEIDLNWVAPTQNTDGSPLTDLSGFTIYYGAAAGGSELGAIPIGDPAATTHTITATIPNDTRVFVRMTASNFSGEESQPSNEVGFGPFSQSAVLIPAPVGGLSGVARIVNCPEGFVCTVIGQ